MLWCLLLLSQDKTNANHWHCYCLNSTLSCFFPVFLLSLLPLLLLLLTSYLHSYSLITLIMTLIGTLWTDKDFGFWVSHFYISKFWEFLDTWIIILKGKKPILLQTYHHAGVVLLMWMFTVSTTTTLTITITIPIPIPTYYYNYEFSGAVLCCHELCYLLYTSPNPNHFTFHFLHTFTPQSSTNFKQTSNTQTL
jgi:hypothetical protein